MKKITDNLTSTNQNYLFPFFWQHGESDEKIKEYIHKIYETGITNLCIESRPHPDFLGDGWWKSLDFIISEAKKLKMKLWILDDARFPTGYANGKVPEHLKKVYLNYRRFDVTGMNPDAEIDLHLLAGMRALMGKEDHSKDKIVKVLMAKNDLKSKDSFVEDSLVDITHQVQNDILHVSIVDEHVSIFVLYQTNCGGEVVTKDYLNPLSKEATQILINEVYEKHYNHYKSEFNKTIVGFFSDEPRFGNVKGTEGSIGRSEMVLPWIENMLKLMSEKIDDFTETQLIFLFLGNSEIAHQTRFHYMDLVSKMYQENFSMVIGDWCKFRNVDYVGHVIEDNNAHARLGYGAGHFFRSMAGQNMAGIDIIGGQIVPGMDYHHEAFSTGGSDGEFYHYALCKMGASLAKLDPSKNGQLMCEAFGAYGWVEGLKMMKWITDHMLSHGVNVIVPHAFNPKEFPDWDCPPHFYAHGNNPQFPYFHKWVEYTNRCTHLFSGGFQVCKVGVLYHGFAEWSGDYMPIQKVLKELQQNQIDCNVISEDYLFQCDINQGKYTINQYDYEALIIPFAERLPEDLLNQISKLSKNNIPVYFIKELPQGYINEQCKVIALNDIANEIFKLDINEFSLSEKCEKLVIYHYHQNDGEVIMFSNEEINKTICTHVEMKITDNMMIYDAYENRVYKFESEKIEDKQGFDLCLQPYQSLILVSGNADEVAPIKGKLIETIHLFKKVSAKSYDSDDFKKANLNEMSHFSGEIIYEVEITLKTINSLLVIPQVYETVQVYVNGVDCGVKICPEYVFDLSKVALVGVNNVEIHVINTLARNQRDAMSQYIALEPLGIIGGLQIYEKLIKDENNSAK